MTREVFLICENKNIEKRFELKFAVKNEEEEDCLVQDLGQEYIIHDVCYKENKKPIKEYGKRWGRVKSYGTTWERMNGTYKKPVTATMYE